VQQTPRQTPQQTPRQTFQHTTQQTPQHTTQQTPQPTLQQPPFSPQAPLLEPLIEIPFTQEEEELPDVPHIDNARESIEYWANLTAENEGNLL
jgi:hypothetical protein